MIQANELRIGNWVNHLSTPTKILTGAQIDKNASDCQPIPLTTDILFKCNFTNIEDEEDNPGWHKKNKANSNNFTIWNFSGALTLDGYSSAPLQYVHQLQNIYFGLTGEELTMNL